MKVLLYQDIEKLGWLGDVVEVAEGYARNYLLPQGLAGPATEANIKAIAEEKARRAETRRSERERLEKMASTVEAAEAVIAAAANVQGHLFGSVTARDIAVNLNDQGFEVTDKQVQLPEHSSATGIKQVGTHSITLKFADDLTATVSVVVVPAGGDVEPVKEAQQQTPSQAGQTTEGSNDSEDEQPEE